MDFERLKSRLAKALTTKVPKDAVMPVAAVGLVVCIVVATALSALLRACVSGGL